MPLNKLKRQFEDRRLSMIETLQKGELELSKQHQLYGAIKEIEQFLKAVDYHREQQLAAADFELRKEGPQPFRFAETLREWGERGARRAGSVVYSVYDTVVLGAGRAAKRAHKRVRVYREVLREVRRRENE